MVASDDHGDDDGDTMMFVVIMYIYIIYYINDPADVIKQFYLLSTSINMHLKSTGQKKHKNKIFYKDSYGKIKLESNPHDDN